MVIFTHEDDQTSNHIIDWAYYLNKTFFRVNAEDIEQNIFLELDNNQEHIKISDVDIDNKRRFWFRKWIENLNGDKYPTDYKQSLNKEFKHLSQYLFFSLQNNTWLNKYGDVENTLIQLKEAKKSGLKIPHSIVTSKKSDVIDFYKQHKSIITKPLISHFFKIEGDVFSKSLTTLISNEDILNMNQFFFPTLFQENILKEFELRVFFLKDNFYSMAIFSQKDKQTRVDFRNYNKNKPNRLVPYKLPNHIEAKLILLMKKLGLNSGSIDLIKSIDNEYIFLEVNPTGQLNMVSLPCNYFLEKKIAKFLSHDEK